MTGIERPWADAKGDCADCCRRATALLKTRVRRAIGAEA